VNASLRNARIAFQGELGAFSEAAAIQLLGPDISVVPRATFDSAFAAVNEDAADALLAPVENTLAGSVVRVYDLLLASGLTIVAETILPIEHQLIGLRDARFADIRAVASHPMALAQCERFFAGHPELKRVPAEDTAGSVREVIARGDKSFAGIAARRAAERYGGDILLENIQDDAENFTRFLLLVPARRAEEFSGKAARKVSLAMRLAHRPGALLDSLEPFARNGVNLLKIESRPIHGRPWEYQFFIDVESPETEQLDAALTDARKAAGELRVLGLYEAAPTPHSKG
jgi:prephenate dehydratase